jgi:hypothetical protein
LRATAGNKRKVPRCAAAKAKSDDTARLEWFLSKLFGCVRPKRLIHRISAGFALISALCAPEGLSRHGLDPARAR